MFKLAEMCRNDHHVDCLVTTPGDRITEDTIYVLPDYMDPPPEELGVKWLRWLLGPTAEEADFVWDEGWNIKAPQLYVPIMRPEFTCVATPSAQPAGGREGALSWGCNTSWAKPITWEWPANPRELAHELRHASFLLSGVDVTLLNAEARMCGCPVLTPLKEDEFRDRFKDIGIAFGWTQLDVARESVKEYPEAYAAYEAESPATVTRFLEKCESL